MGGSDITSSPFLSNIFSTESQKDSEPSDKARRQTHTSRHEKRAGETQVFREKGEDLSRMRSPPHHHHLCISPQPPPKAGLVPPQEAARCRKKGVGLGVTWPRV